MVHKSFALRKWGKKTGFHEVTRGENVVFCCFFFFAQNDVIS